jgi:diacylglycerol kinase (ATP)
LKTCLVINPAAGRKAGLTTNRFTVDDARDLLRRHGIEADVFCTERASHATELARQAVADGYERVLVAGGDGTVAEAAEALVGTRAVLGVLPLGSIMNVARMLGVPRDLEGAAEVIQAGRVARIDVGKARAAARERYFLEGAGVGIDAGLFTYANQIDKGNWRSLRPLLWFLWRYRPRRVHLRLDGRSMRVATLMITVANGPYLGAALTLAPEAKLDDRRFDVRIFAGFSKLELLRHLLAISGGRRAYHSKIFTRPARTVEVQADRPLMVHADSHALGTTPARFELVPAALSVLVGADATCAPALTGEPAPVAEDADAAVPLAP